MSCLTLTLPAGASSCIADYGDPKMLGISKVNNIYSTLAAAKSTAGVKAWIDTSLSMIVTNDFQGLESTPPEPVTESTGFGANRDTRFTPGGMIVHLFSNPYAFNSMVTNLAGGTYWIELYLANGYKLLHRNDNGTYCGFKGQITAVPVGIPGLDNKVQQYKLRVNWANVDQFKNVELVQLVDTLDEYVALMPTALGYEMVDSTYAATKISITLFDLADRTSLVSDTLTATIVDSNVVSAAITVAAPTAGVSELTITKASSPVTLASGDWIKFRLHKKTSSVYNSITEIITLKIA
jgi:hypothetical protein